MYQIIQKLILNFQKKDIKSQKAQKMAETNHFLYSHRKAYRPVEPLGFKTRANSAYYLTGSHNKI